MNKPSYKINGRVWIEFSDEKIFGPGRVELLERIQASGSIRQAALQMKMSYKQAWDMINHMNTHFSSAVVITSRGGKGGGNAEVTEHALNAIKQFYELQTRFKDFLKSLDQIVL
ncbi:LysR family transcriptional regulator [Pedobacter sp. MC2016-14]|uniref:winged helix-turn-helix domain-containing protein n=1 Tax=Pedobacter sp. MC2016-14 TaxID=2897327 RepID=UPI001E63D0D4|nr:LysR family transcriptional regulator [Pedobacter sp. MC2016-14]MCD0487795.1 LysR family transcriptional regulator [Pedobacter sp. MC2016-14]